MGAITVRHDESGDFDGFKFSRIAADARGKLTQDPMARFVPPGTYTLDEDDAERFCVAGKNGTLEYE